MLDNLSQYYYQIALKKVKENDITKALEYAQKSFLLAENERNRTLIGLCSYKLGYIKRAEYFLKDIERYSADIEEMLADYYNKRERITSLMSHKKYRKVLKLMLKIKHKTLCDMNYIGCLYMLLHRRSKALFYWNLVLLEDKSNQDALKYIGSM